MNPHPRISARWLGRVIAVFPMVAAGAVLGAGAASAAPPAGTVAISGSSLYYTAKPAEINAITVSLSGGWITVDDIHSLTAGAGCSPVGADNTKVQCAAAGVTMIRVDTGEYSDSVNMSACPIPGWIESGSGNDTLTGGPATTGVATNWLFGGDGDDKLTGGPGTDILAGGGGADTMSGGAGTDSVTYSDHAANVKADLDGAAGDDGASGEGDTIASDVENLYGGDGNDTLKGNSGPNAIGGYGGMDTLLGLAGDDSLNGGTLRDILDGGAGADTMLGGDGNDLVRYLLRFDDIVADLDGVPGDDGAAGEGDTIGADVEDLEGGVGNDSLTGNSSGNVLYGGSGFSILGGPPSTGGNDILNGGGGTDYLDGGRGADVINGGTGFDFVRYINRTAPVIADLDGAAGDDGEVGEGDTIAVDVEGLAGGSGNDVLAGNNGNNVLSGFGGTDSISGLGGNDTLDGGGDPGDHGNGGSGDDNCYDFTTTAQCEVTVEPPD